MNMKHLTKYNYRKAFSLIEVLTVVMIAGMILVSTVNIYHRVKTSAARIDKNLEVNTLANEILQLIAEDLDRLAAPGFDTTITIQNKINNGFQSAQMIIENKIYNSQSKAQTFEKVVWQTNYDAETDSMILYRSHSGINLEDKLLDTQYEEAQEVGDELYIPLCIGVSHFEIKVKRRDDYLDRWTSATLPKSITAWISFAPFAEDEFGNFTIPDHAKTFRTIAIDRTRTIPYKFVKVDFEKEYLEDLDPNEIPFAESPYDDSSDMESTDQDSDTTDEQL